MLRPRRFESIGVAVAKEERVLDGCGVTVVKEERVLDGCGESIGVAVAKEERVLGCGCGESIGVAVAQVLWVLDKSVSCDAVRPLEKCVRDSAEAGRPTDNADNGRRASTPRLSSCAPSCLPPAPPSSPHARMYRLASLGWFIVFSVGVLRESKVDSWYPCDPSPSDETPRSTAPEVIRNAPTPA
jgi:hypothetical protein